MTYQTPSASRTVVALAGRRIDPEPTDNPRFPFDRVEAVRLEITRILQDSNAVAMVCSAACGADLVGAELAQSMNLDTVIVLPFKRGIFRQTSVVDRPRSDFWGFRYDGVIARAEREENLIQLDFSAGDDASYTEANGVILENARRLGAKYQEQSSCPVGLIALVVWEGKARASSDATWDFMQRAQQSGFIVHEVTTTRMGAG